MALDERMAERLRTLQAVAFDVDGVLTDGRLTWSPTGEESKSFNFTDIMGVSLLRRLGITMALISGEATPQVDLFANRMHIPFVTKGTREKATALRDFAKATRVELERTCFFGDDVNDLFAMEIAGICACPANAAAEVLAYVGGRAALGSGYVSWEGGGSGAVRAFADAVIAARGLRGQNVFLIQPPA